MPTTIALQARTLRPFVRNGSEQMAIAADMLTACLWSMLGLLLTSAAFALGVGAELGQALAIAG